MSRGKSRSGKTHRSERRSLAAPAPVEERVSTASSVPTASAPGAPASPPPVPARRAMGLLRVGSIDFIGHRRRFLGLSAVLIAVSLLSLAFVGLNYGIDFTGGNEYTMVFSGPVDESRLRSVLTANGVSGAKVQPLRDHPEQAIVRTTYLDTEGEARMLSALESDLGLVEASAAEAVNPIISGELITRKALPALALACLGILAYIALRFEFRFAVASVAALIHDSIITLGFFSLAGFEITSSFVAAILTVIGYSINDTIVVFDRIRDNLKQRGRESLGDLANRSVNETFVRSVNTSVTALLAITAIYLFGGETTRDFALALIVGIVVGTYSSIFVATPIWLAWRRRDEHAVHAEQSKAIVARKRA